MARPDPAPSVTSDFLIRQLLEVHRGDEWATFRELANGTGSHKSRQIDLYAINLWPSNGFQSLAYEVKVDRADFRRELDDPTKRAPWDILASEGWYVAPAGVIPVAEVPEGWGLMEWTGTGWKRPRRAHQRKLETFPATFTVALARRIADPKPVEPLGAWDFLGRRITAADLVRLADKLATVQERRARRNRVTFEDRDAHAPGAEDYVIQERARVRADSRRLGGLAAAVRHLCGRQVETAEAFTAWHARLAPTAALASPDLVDELRDARHLITLALGRLDPGEAAETAAEPRHRFTWRP